MVKAVRNSARLISTGLGGVSGMPNAWRTIASTTTIRTKLVMLMKIAGATAISVSSSMVRTRSVLMPAPSAAKAVAGASSAAASR